MRQEICGKAYTGGLKSMKVQALLSIMNKTLKCKHKNTSLFKGSAFHTCQVVQIVLN